MSQCAPCCAPPGAPSSACKNSSGWVDSDNYATFAASLSSTTGASLARYRGVVGAPRLVPGTIYSVTYQQDFRISNHYSQGPTTYAFRGVCESSANRCSNFMYVIGPINGTHQRQVLVIFYNPQCQPGPAGGGEACVPGTWIPAVYSYETGELFSEVGTARVEGGSARYLCWTSVGRDVCVSADNLLLGREVHYARVVAEELCDCGERDLALKWLGIIVGSCLGGGSGFSEFVDLGALQCLVGLQPGDVVSRPGCECGPCPCDSAETQSLSQDNADPQCCAAPLPGSHHCGASAPETDMTQWT